MQWVGETAQRSSVVTSAGFGPSTERAGTRPDTTRFVDFKVIRRNGSVVGFEPGKIAVAMTKAFLAVNGGQGAASARVRELVEQLTQVVVGALMRSKPAGGTFHIEDIQDQVELSLMRSGEHEVARAYVLYRERRAQERAARQAQQAAQAEPHPLLVVDAGTSRPLDMAQLREIVESACEGLGAFVVPDAVLSETLKNLYDGMPIEEVHKSAILSARALIEKDPAYSQVTARLLLHTVRREVLGEEVVQADMVRRYAEYFPEFVRHGVEADLLDPRLLQFDLPRLGAALVAERDQQFAYLGLQTLYDRYFLHVDERRIELPQAFFMRVAMGLALNEIDREARAMEFYELLSKFDFMSSTPTLFNSGTQRSQLSSCYLTTVSDDLDGIYEAIKENALLAKYAGGLGNDWTPVRALGSHIKGTNGKSQGVVPFLKVVNDTAVAVNQGGKRKGAVCAYLETWHLDIEEFLELRKNTGDDRRRTHDMNTANWIPDLFMKRVMENAEWTLFSPADCADLHDKVGRAFEQAYLEYERKAEAGELKLFKKVPATTLWRKMLSMLFETGHPWITFKDPCNIRSPQQHVGVVHSSNLCTEITLNTSDTEIAVCNLGSVNLVAHMREDDGSWSLDHAKLKRTIATAMRMLDNVIDINYYAVGKARNSNLKHRPVGLGRHGLPGLPAPDAHALRGRGGRRVRRPVDGGRLLLRLLGVDRAGPGARPLRQLQGLAVGPRHPAAGLAEAAGRAAWRRLPGGRPVRIDGLGGAAQAHRAVRHAQLQLRGDRADRDHLQHHRRGRVHRTHLPEPLRQIEPLGRVHGRQRLPGARPEGTGPVGRGDGRRPEVLRRHAGAHRPDPGRAALDLRDGLRGRPGVAGRVRVAPPEVDRPGAVAEHLHGGRLGQEAARDLQARVAARPEDHLLPAHAGRDARREEHGRQGRPAQRGVRGGPRGQLLVRRAVSSLAPAAADEPIAPKFCAIDDPECEACQ